MNAEEISLKKYKELNMQMLYLWKIQIGSGLGTAYAAVASLLGGRKTILNSSIHALCSSFSC